MSSRIPKPEYTPNGPVYEGRALHRLDDEVVDQGVAFDIGTLVSRRSLLGIFGAGVGAAALVACSPGGTGSAASPSATASATATSTASGTVLSEIPDETAGPYPGDGSNGADVLEQSGIVRSDIRSSIDGGTSASGVPMTLTLTVLDMANGNVPFKDAAVYVWHCDAAGGYSMYSQGIQNETYLRGVQVADADGKVTYSSIYPACYTGRWPHIHFEVYPAVGDITDSSKAIATSQVALPQDISETVYALSGYAGSSSNLAQVSLTSDNVFGDDGGALQLAQVTGDSASGYAVALTVGVDTSTTPAAGGAPGGGMPPGGGGPGSVSPR
ncbi:intradiol ring-cleavage dioxygenase [Paenarthrobacter ilicis]|uniref:Protocatechuate 3,4-dioxygenase beta subunit n=1 Tax=Paenarthrobacter ilicis TaxID=43665 RepID=A0ABX0TK34_9MICC|nr:intradiol ring-cleavage dioxygenase [Paenarthrobacter ilicis]MBM7793068.1 protocatechuate 3,4-dioxygenase beta subunit [Paenarthrobacter ilicis]NIJ02156.1 protocatechuate 3,4-dioxygenase beta subunit [Paenarthrobacter ilicis]